MIAAAQDGVVERFLADESETIRLGEDIAMALRPGDALALVGDLGAGKTTLARGLIRAMAHDAGLEVPSPTFTLVQSYDLRVPIHHYDLYRLSSPDELDELGLDEALASGAALIEWPEHAGDRLPNGTIIIALTDHGAGRLVRISGTGSAFARIERSLAMRDFLGTAGWGQASRAHFTGDASARSYELVTLPGEPVRVLMNSPRLVLGPPVRDGKPYAVIAHTAQSVAAFVAIDAALAKAGVSVPDIYAQDLDGGFLLISHLGSEGILDAAGRPVAERYAASAELLAAIHTKGWPRQVPVAPGIVHDLPPFDRAALMIEVDLLPVWYVPYTTGNAADEALLARYAALWNTAFDRLDSAEQSIVLRDVHSPNIIWRGDRSRHDRLGIIDFQDAMYGAAAYDMASLAMDARVTISPEIEASTVKAYVDARKAAGPFDEMSFAEAYAITAAQRNSKILGIFVRLDRRDGKPAYLKHLPRIRDYLARALAHPALSEMRDFYRANGFIDRDRS